MENPRFLKADIEFVVDAHSLFFPDRHVTIAGATGLPWKPLSPSKHFGLRVVSTLSLPEGRLETEALVTREHSLTGTTMGLRFLPQPSTHDALSRIFASRGATRPGFVRQFPRIPSVGEIRSFPLFAVATAPIPPAGNPAQDRQLAFEVRNLSLAGTLVSSDAPAAASIRPGDRLHLELQPRGGSRAKVLVYGYVCRVTDEVNAVNGNLLQFFAIRFLNTSREGRRAFLDLLRDIVRRIELDAVLTTIH